MRKFILCLFCTLLIAPWMLAQTPDSAPGALPSIITDGLALYKTNGPEAVIRSWIKGGPLDGNRDAFAQVGLLRQAQDLYGIYQGFEVYSSQPLSRRTQLTYLVMHYAKGPLFARLVTYQTSDGWMVISFNFSKDDSILPELMPLPPANP